MIETRLLSYFLTVAREQNITKAASPKECPVFLANVTFEPGCRNNWHIHHADKGGGQILVCTAGQGVYQEWGKEAQILNPGDVVYIKPGVKHYHGAVSDSWFSHIAVECPGENCSNEWCEPVTDEQYLGRKKYEFRRN